ncbi:MAG: hypothetical protein LQ339_007652 [Xanthoria mediterranea]|nr:MAG: hypothetical protein LQ339_007652 [Xanthoria mediterranea]
MDTIFHIFHHAQYTRDGTVLGNLLSPIPPKGDPSLLQRFYKDSNVFDIQSDITQYIKSPQTTLPKDQRNAWIDIYVAYWRAIGEILRAESGNHRNDWAIKVYESWKEVINLVIRGYSGSSGFQSWTLPVLYTAGKYLRVFAIKADEEQAAKVGTGAVKMETDGLGDDVTSGGLEKNERLEDAARVINRVFTLCISDRAPMEESRKWGLYHTTNLLFKTYFKLNSISLSKNCLRAIQASATDMPPMSHFPKAHIVTFKYYVGVIHFLDEEYHKAEENLTAAYRICHRDAQSNKNLILTYLVPTYLHTTLRLPPTTSSFGQEIITTLFHNFLCAIHLGALGRFNLELETHAHVFVKRRIYLSLERARELCLRNLLKRCWIVAGDKEKPRVRVKEWAAAVRWSAKAGGEGGFNSIQPRRVVDEGHVDMEDVVADGEAGERMDGEMDDDEVECLVSGLIYKGLLKGYISRDHGIIVLNRKGEIFPGTGV